MTKLTKPIVRLCLRELDGTFCADSGSKIAVRLVPATTSSPDLIEMWPYRTRRVERLALQDVFKIAIRYRVGRDLLEKARSRKARKAQRLANLRQQRAEKRLFEKS